ncbi:MAG: TonB-dependent receptor [Rhodanobacter sp.]|nr:TonB-dependent receptor [Rhodanobacter sp.]
MNNHTGLSVRLPRRTALALSLALGLVAGGVSAQQAPAPESNAAATDSRSAQQAPNENKKAKDLNGVTVTGSLIPKAQIETATPTIQITAEDIKTQGFVNVSDALRSLPQANGAVLGNAFTNGFTPGANTISLFGLDPGYTLNLIDGHPMANYPLLYNSTGTIVDLSTIPMAMVDHIDIVPGSQSAIYGSSAIAGVINVVLKKNVDGYMIDLRGGGYSRGGGSNQRVQFVGGNHWDKLSVNYALEYSKQSPIYNSQRSWTDSTARNPTLLPGQAAIPGLSWVRWNGLTGKFIDPGQATCAALASQYENSTVYATRPEGHYCGSTKSSSYGTMLNQSKHVNGYVNVKYDLNNNTQLYGDLLYNHNTTSYTNGFSTFWWGSTPVAPYIFNSNTGLYERYQVQFTPEEVGTAADRVLKQDAYTGTVGVRGTFGDSSWGYDAYFHRSGYETDSNYLRPLASKVNAYFLGQQNGIDPTYHKYPVYDVRLDRFYSVIPLADIMGFSDYVKSNSRTWTQDANLQVNNTSLFKLPAGDVGFAAVLQTGKEYWNQPIDPRVSAGEFWGTGGTTGKGDRNHNGAAVEFNVPIFSMLTADVAARYDKYKYAGNSDGRFTWKAGLEFRPFDSLLLRGNYGTAYRAPEMSYVFAGPSRSYTNVYDYYLCRLQYGDQVVSTANGCPSNLSSVQVQSGTSGNPKLKSVTARSWGFGAVWSPTPDFNLHVDYTRIAIKNEVASRSVGNIASLEASCRLGHTVDGTPVDGSSTMCQQVYALITRNPASDPLNPNQLQKIITYPLNMSSENVANVSAGAQWRLSAGRFGNFVFSGDFFRPLMHTERVNPEDSSYDRLNSRDWGFGTEFKNIFTGSVTWKFHDVSTTLYGIRYAPTWSYNGQHHIGPWIRYNASVNWQVRDNVSLSLISNNILNKMPPRDRTFSAFPYYDVYNYNIYGRSIMAEMQFRFGGSR